jgi:hypothetical protein
MFFDDETGRGAAAGYESEIGGIVKKRDASGSCAIERCDSMDRVPGKSLIDKPGTAQAGKIAKWKRCNGFKEHRSTQRLASKSREEG